MKKPLREQAVEYLQYLKEQGLTHVPASGRKPAQPPSPLPAAAAAPATTPASN